MCNMNIDIDIQNGHGRTAWTRTCRIDIDMKNGHGQAAKTAAGHGYAAWT
jgi:hypothetical protein